MSLNRVSLIGRLGRDPEKRFMPSGDPVANFSLATSEFWKDKAGQKQERTEWHHIVIFGKLAEVACSYLKKGQQVYLEGKISSRKYMAKDHTERIAYDIVCDQMVMLGSKGEGSTSFDPPPIGTVYPSEQVEEASSVSSRSAVIEEKKIDVMDIESDIPF
ncbi:MAG: single-stranded DNA-binding protein [Neisseriaceae bacterium]